MNRAIELLTQLCEEYPTVAEYQRQLALCYRERSVSEYSADVSQALAMLHRLVDEFPTVDDFRFDLSQTYAMVHTRDIPAEHRATAEFRLREAVRHADRLDDNVPAYRMLQTHVHHRLARMLDDGSLPWHMYYGWRFRMRCELAHVVSERGDRDRARQMLEAARADLLALPAEMHESRFWPKYRSIIDERLSALREKE